MVSGRRLTLSVVHDMKIKKGIKLLDDREGEGDPAEKGDDVIYNLRAYLSKGDEIPVNPLNPECQYPENLLTTDDKGTMINYHCRIGRRDAIAAVEYSLIGMKEGGYRKIKASPHLAYRDEGVPGKVPANAVILFEIWLRKLQKKVNAQPANQPDAE